MFLIISITNLTLPADGPFVNTGRPSLRPGAQSLTQVTEVLVLVKSAQCPPGTNSCLVIPEFGIHQNTIVIEEYVLLHPLDPSPR